MYTVKLNHVVNVGYVKAKATPKVKICRHCKHYDKNQKTCRLFEAIDLVTGEEHSVQASHARESTNMCGLGGALFEHHMNKP